ncbi:glycosyltransferase family 61 protein [Burkholderia stagnalis]|uniref:glycosyltransferase family 61 protein n=1 Tax=Burkholderia stagnalis TaxID=1503054 RepID=UPI000AB108FD|nr:glycosyltransferase family 61 protein [Burkholderia stagnalis]
MNLKNWLLIKLFRAIKVVNEPQYLERYPDVAAAGIDPIEHYVLFGRHEGRLPSDAIRNAKAAFLTTTRIVDEEYYARKYPDVASSTHRPVHHFIDFGAAERRHPNAFFERRASAKMKRKALKIQHSRTGMLQKMRSAPVKDRPAILSEIKDHLWSCAAHGNLRGLERSLSRLSEFEYLVDAHLIARVTRVLDVRQKSSVVRLTPLEPSQQHQFREPRVVGENRARPLRTVEVPTTWIATVQNADVIGAFQVISSAGLIWYEPAADPRNDFVAGAWQYVTPVRGHHEKALVWFKFEQEDHLDEGILISGRCSPNYFHWLIEYLTRARLAELHFGHRKTPLIVDAHMFPQQFQSLKHVCGDWPIYQLRQSTRLKVSTLHIPSIQTFLPDSLQVPFWASSGLNFQSIEYLKTKIFASLGIQNGDSFANRRVFLARRNGRNIINVAEVEAVAAKAGFEIIDTAAMSFEAQVRLFASAGAIAGPLGAAFTNIIFCDARCRVLGLTTPFAKSFTLYSNLATSAGCSYATLAGEHPLYQPGDEDRNRDLNLTMASFSIPIDRLRSALLELIE